MNFFKYKIITASQEDLDTLSEDFYEFVEDQNNNNI